VSYRGSWLAAALVAAGFLSLAAPASAGAALSGKVIAVDPGHGGRDPGAIANGVHEKDLTLAVALQLKTLLEGQGARVVMTRASDTGLGPNTDADLQARVTIAQQAHADAFVSIHGNETADPHYAGATTYYGTACGYYSGVTLSPSEVGRSYALAGRLQSALAQRTQEADRGAKSMPFWVLGDRGIPSILVETGFLSNAAEAAKLANPAYQHVIADAIGDGLASYFADGDATGQLSAPSNAFRGCPNAAPATQASPRAAPEHWVQTFLPAPLLSGPDPHAKQFAILGPFSYLKVLDHQNDYFHVLNPLTNGPGYVEAKKVGPSGPPQPKPAAPTFQPLWVQNFRPVQLWSTAAGKTTSFGTLPPWHFFQVMAPSTGPRFLVKVDTTGNVAYLDRVDVGPSGPPPANKPAAAAAKPSPAVASPGPSASTRVTIQPGETLSAIALRYRTTVAALLAINGLETPDHVLAGQTLVVPASGSSAAVPATASRPSPATRVTVQPGETLSAVAAKHHTTIDTLVTMNGLKTADRVLAGQTLLVPA